MALVKKRPVTGSPRSRHLYTDVTEAEHDAIFEYCRQRGVSVSEFVANLLLKDADEAKNCTARKSVVIQPKLTLTAEQYGKLEMLMRMHQKESPEEYILGLLKPEFELRRVHAPVKTKMLRYYLSDEEHEIVMKHINDSGMSARNFAAMAVLKEIRKSGKKKASKKRRKK
jgi:hypothetical protein